MKGYRTVLAFSIALAAAVYQYFVGPLPEIDPKLWNVIVAAGGLYLRFNTTTPVGQKE